MTGAMHTAAQSLPSAILALLPSPHLRDFLKALRFLLLQGQAPAQPDQVPRFLNSYPWPTRALIRLARQEAETTLHRARRRRGPKPRLLVVLDLVTLEKRGTFPLLPLSFFHGKWGLHLVVLYLVYGDLRVPWVYRLWRGQGEKSLSLLALRLLAALPPWMRKAFGIRVVADAAFGTLGFRTGAQGMGLEAVVGMRRDRRTREGQRLLNLRRQGSGLCGLGQWVPLPSAQGAGGGSASGISSRP